MHRSMGTDTPLLLFLPSVPSGAAAETGPTKVVCERACKTEGWRGKERRRDRRRLLEGGRGKREKEEFSSGFFPPPLPSPPRGGKSSPALAAAPGGCSPTAPATPWPPHRDGHNPITMDPPTPAMVQQHPWLLKPTPRDASSHQPAPPARDRNPQPSKQHPGSPRVTKGGHHHLPTP